VIARGFGAALVQEVSAEARLAGVGLGCGCTRHTSSVAIWGSSTQPPLYARAEAAILRVLSAVHSAGGAVLSRFGLSGCDGSLKSSAEENASPGGRAGDQREAPARSIGGIGMNKLSASWRDGSRRRRS